MTAPRSRREFRNYRRQRRLSRAAGDVCPFCTIEQGHADYIEETSAFRVIRNISPYSIWDGQGVKDHLLIVPKQHTEKLGELGDTAAAEFLQLIDKYEDLGYNVFARAPMSRVKSVAHQHTHLIRPDDNQTSFIFYLRKPFYIRLSK